MRWTLSERPPCVKWPERATADAVDDVALVELAVAERLAVEQVERDFS